MSTDNAPSAPADKSQPPSAVRRAIPWIVVLILFLLLGMEYLAQSEHGRSVKEVIKLVGPPDVAESRAITSTKVQEVLRGKNPSTIEDVSNKNLDNGSAQVEVYRWFSINPFVRRELYVYYGSGHDPKVICASAVEDAQSSGGAYHR